MATERIRGYMMSDDFDRFYELVNSRVDVIYTSERDKWAIKCANFQKFGRQEWNLRKKFFDHNYRFIDPDDVIDHATQRIAPLAIADDRRVSGMPGDDRIKNIRFFLGQISHWYGRR